MAAQESEFDRTDRILLGSCAGIWLAALGAGVAATVALVDLGRGHPQATGESGTPWLLYSVIAISALVIIGAVPLLLRARREAAAETQAPPRPAARQAPGRTPPPAPGVEMPTEKLRISASPAGRFNSGPGYAAPWTDSPSLPPALVNATDRVWLRCTLVIACAIGIAFVATGVATYLMAVDNEGVAWACYVLTGLVILAMPAAPVFYLRELRGLLDRQAA
jgi:Protein of unknown function (DUF2561)